MFVHVTLSELLIPNSLEQKRIANLGLHFQVLQNQKILSMKIVRMILSAERKRPSKIFRTKYHEENPCKDK